MCQNLAQALKRDSDSVLSNCFSNNIKSTIAAVVNTGGAYQGLGDKPA